MNCIRLLQFSQRQVHHFLKVPSTARCISGHHYKYIETQDRWRQRDGMSPEWQLIYKGPMDKGIKIITTYITVTTTAATGGGLYYGLFQYDPSDLDKPILLGNEVVIANSPIEVFVYLGVFIAMHVAVKVLISKFVVRLYQNGDEYTAIFRGHFYNSIKKYKFHLKDFKKLNPTWVVSWGDSRYGLGKKTAILIDNYFKTPEYLNYLLGDKNSLDDVD